jgi:hypothetical protein
MTDEMATHTLRVLLVLTASLTVSLGCSADDDAPGSQGSGANAALANRECYLGLQVPGVTHTGFACSGSETHSSVTGLKPNAFEPALSVSLALVDAPAIGDLNLTSLSVDIPKEGVSQRWEAPADACQAIATDSATEEDFGWVYFRIEISCSQAALPADANPGAPLELGDFVLVTFFSAD